MGDPHATPEELEDCENLMQLVLDTATSSRADVVTLLGDLYNTHDVLNIRVIEFWKRWLTKLEEVCDVAAVLGNHDQVTPTQRFPHALMAHPEISVYDRPLFFLSEAHQKVAVVPYCHDNEEFLTWVHELAERGEPHTLICHQTFDGSRYENGFYAKDGVPVEQLPKCFKTVISGHIHTPQKIGPVVYVGAPRWRTRSDVNVDRHLWLLEHSEQGTKLLSRTPTGPHLRRLWAYDDRPGNPVNPVGYSRSKDKLWVDVYGPDAAYVRDRETELKATYGAVTRPFPDRERRAEVTESVGAGAAFWSFLGKFRSPYGTDLETLQKMAEDRIGRGV